VTFDRSTWHFDLETKRVLGVALEMVCLAVRTGDCDDHVKQAIADKLNLLSSARAVTSSR
jgi:hypothetical protein